MEEKRELNLEEMEKISGGIHDQQENRRYEIFGGTRLIALIAGLSSALTWI